MSNDNPTLKEIAESILDSFDRGYTITGGQKRKLRAALEAVQARPLGDAFRSLAAAARPGAWDHLPQPAVDRNGPTTPRAHEGTT